MGETLSESEGCARACACGDTSSALSGWWAAGAAVLWPPGYCVSASPAPSPCPEGSEDGGRAAVVRQQEG